jgi:hypothetical protein
MAGALGGGLAFIVVVIGVAWLVHATVDREYHQWELATGVHQLTLGLRLRDRLLDSAVGRSLLSTSRRKSRRITFRVTGGYAEYAEWRCRRCGGRYVVYYRADGSRAERHDPKAGASCSRSMPQKGHFTISKE